MSYATKIEELIAERDKLRADYESACKLVADMHAAAMGGVVGPAAGVVEDVAALREDAKRFRWLRGDFSPMGMSIDGNHAWAYRRNATLQGPTLDAAIDTAMLAR
jgi:hypothetical protein